MQGGDKFQQPRSGDSSTKPRETPTSKPAAKQNHYGMFSHNYPDTTSSPNSTNDSAMQKPTEIKPAIQQTPTEGYRINADRHTGTERIVNDIRTRGDAVSRKSRKARENYKKVPKLLRCIINCFACAHGMPNPEDVMDVGEHVAPVVADIAARAVTDVGRAFGNFAPQARERTSTTYNTNSGDLAQTTFRALGQGATQFMYSMMASLDAPQPVLQSPSWQMGHSRPSRPFGMQLGQQFFAQQAPFSPMWPQNLSSSMRGDQFPSPQPPLNPYVFLEPQKHRQNQ
jgi:hypothetical protein